MRLVSSIPQPANLQVNKVGRKQHNVSFGASQLNIFATADNHGKLANLPPFFANIVKNAKAIFAQTTQTNESTVNIGIFNGDWFMDPAKGGYITDPSKKAGDYQSFALGMLIDSIKQMAPGFKAFFIPGNHDYDGGDRLLINHLKDNDITTIMSNTKIKTSSAIQELPVADQSKFVNKVVIDIPDDKNPAIVNKVLMLGVTIPGLEFYVPGGTDGMDIIDKNNKKDAKLMEKDLQATFKRLDTMIAEFKQANPKGLVILNDHTSFRITEIIVRNLKEAPDIIFDGHDHKDETNIIRVKGINGEYIKSVPVFSLQDDNEKFDAIKVHFDDEGVFDRYNMITYYSSNARELKNNPFTKFVDEAFVEDRKPLLHISGPEHLEELSPVNVRKDNNLLANFVTDAILDQINTGDNKLGRDTQILCIGSSGLRQGLAVNDKTDNLKVRNVFSDPIEAISKVSVANMKGSDIALMTIENMAGHKLDMDRNTMFQWSGVQIMKTDLIDIINENDTENDKRVAQTIRVKNDNGVYEPIDFNKEYKIAIPDYFFVRPKSPTAIRLHKEGKLESLGKTLNELFREYAVKHNYNLTLPPAEERVVVR